MRYFSKTSRKNKKVKWIKKIWIKITIQASLKQFTTQSSCSVFLALLNWIWAILTTCKSKCWRTYAKIFFRLWFLKMLSQSDCQHSKSSRKWLPTNLRFFRASMKIWSNNLRRCEVTIPKKFKISERMNEHARITSNSTLLIHRFSKKWNISWSSTCFLTARKYPIPTIWVQMLNLQLTRDLSRFGSFMKVSWNV